MKTSPLCFRASIRKILAYLLMITGVVAVSCSPTEARLLSRLGRASALIDLRMELDRVCVHICGTAWSVARSSLRATVLFASAVSHSNDAFSHEKWRELVGEGPASDGRYLMGVID